MAGEVAALERESALIFPIALADGGAVATIGDAATLFETLGAEQRAATGGSPSA